jgi:hypothetical protein
VFDAYTGDTVDGLRRFIAAGETGSCSRACGTSRCSSSRVGVVEQFAVAHHAATDEPIGGRCRDVLEAAARAALMQRG